MTEKPTLPVFNEVFGDLLRPAPQPAPDSEFAPSTGEAANAKLKRNLNLALERHKDIMSLDIGPESPVGEKRLVLEAATATVKAALTTDRTALKARSNNTLERVFLRLLFIKLQMGRAVKPEDVTKLKTAPRKELEEALGPLLADYDRMEW
jgi:hypothetical protein